MELQEPCDDETLTEFLFRASESQSAYDLLGDDKPLRLACAQGEWLKVHDPIEPHAMPREVKTSLSAVPEGAVSFSCICDSGRPCRIEPYPFPVIHDLASMRLDEEKVLPFLSARPVK